MAALQQSAVSLSYINQSAGVASPASPSSAAGRSLALRSVSSITGLSSLRLSRPVFRLPAAGRRQCRGGATMNTAAGSYAAALAEVAKSNDSLEKASQQMENVAGVLAEPQVLGFFTDPTVLAEEKQKAVDEIAESLGLEPYIANFVNIVVEMKRVDLFRDIAKEFEICYNKITGTELAVVASVVPMDNSHLAQIAKSVQRLTGAQNVRLKTEIDPSLVAGFTIRYGSSGSKLIDMSVRKQLDEIAKQLEFNVDLVPLSS